MRCVCFAAWRRPRTSFEAARDWTPRLRRGAADRPGLEPVHRLDGRLAVGGHWRISHEHRSAAHTPRARSSLGYRGWQRGGTVRARGGKAGSLGEECRGRLVTLYCVMLTSISPGDPAPGAEAAPDAVVEAAAWQLRERAPRRRGSGPLPVVLLHVFHALRQNQPSAGDGAGFDRLGNAFAESLRRLRGEPARTARPVLPRCEVCARVNARR